MHQKVLILRAQLSYVIYYSTLLYTNYFNRYMMMGRLTVGQKESLLIWHVSLVFNKQEAMAVAIIVIVTKIPVLAV